MWRLAISALMVPALAACLGPQRDDDAWRSQADPPGWRLSDGRLRSLAGCHYDWRLLEPRAPAHDALVVIGHGFLRNQQTMADLARALAAAGSRVATLDFCNMKPWNGHHRRNAADMLALARHLGADRAVLVGFSAGALAALIATARDAREQGPAGPHVLGAVLLDPVDQDDMGLRALSRSQVPIVAMQGPPSSCNAGAVAGRRWAAGRPIDLLSFDDASHCEFESPTDWLCRSLCGDDQPADRDERTRRAVIAATVQSVAGILAETPAASPR